MDYFIKGFKEYANFSGRARRKEYWMFYLFSNLIVLVVTIISVKLKLTNFGGLLSLVIVIPNLSVAVRRLHDVNKSGLWLLINFIPLIGSIWFLILLCTEGTVGDNNYGEDPKINENKEIPRI